MVKIAICGKMASGKTTLAEGVVTNYDFFRRYSLADAVKQFANFVYDIPEGVKDRVAYQKIGDGARKQLYEDIWIDTLIKQIENNNKFHDMNGRDFGLDWETPTPYCIVDDVRYLNEVIKLKADGWVMVKIDISDELQIERLKRTYPANWETHVGARHHASESEVDKIPNELFDLIVTAEDGDAPYHELESLIIDNKNAGHQSPECSQR